MFPELLQHGKEYELFMVRKTWDGQAVIGEIMADCVTYKTLERLAVIYPAGRHRLKLAESPRLKRKPASYMKFIENDPTAIWIMGVPEREDLQIHPGCFLKDTDGCTLPGVKAQGQRLIDSRKAFVAIRRALYNAQARGQKLFLNVVEINRPEKTGQKEGESMNILKKIGGLAKKIISVPGQIIAAPEKLISGAAGLAAKAGAALVLPLQVLDRAADFAAWYVASRKEIKSIFREIPDAFRRACRLALAPFGPPLRIVARILSVLARGAEIITPSNPKDEEMIRRVEQRLVGWADSVETGEKMQNLDDAVRPQTS